MNSHTINRIIVFSPWNVFIYIILCNHVITVSYFRSKGEEAEVKGFAQVEWQSQGLYHPTLRTMAITLGPWYMPKPSSLSTVAGWVAGESEALPVSSLEAVMGNGAQLYAFPWKAQVPARETNILWKTCTGLSSLVPDSLPAGVWRVLIDCNHERHSLIASGNTILPQFSSVTLIISHYELILFWAFSSRSFCSFRLNYIIIIRSGSPVAQWSGWGLCYFDLSHKASSNFCWGWENWLLIAVGWTAWVS